MTTGPYPRKARANDPYADAPFLPGTFPDKLHIESIFLGATSSTPIELEIGGGRGAFAFERLGAAPDACLLGFEIRKKWATIVDRKLHALRLAHRGRCFAEDARFALPRLAPDARVRAV